MKKTFNANPTTPGSAGECVQWASLGGWGLSVKTTPPSGSASNFQFQAFTGPHFCPPTFS